MTDAELRALISLLEDSDPQIRAHVQDKLLSMGLPVIPTLEEVWETESDAQVQEQIEELIFTIQSSRTMDDLLEWQAGGGRSLLEGWYYISRYQFPELDFSTYRNYINRVVSRIWLELRAGMSMAERLSVVNRMIYEREKYRASDRALYDPAGHFLNTLIDTKKGSPLSLGMLYLCVCDELELPVRGLMMPEYFALMYQDPQTEFFIDVFNNGKFFLRRDLVVFLRKMDIKDETPYLEAASHPRIVMTLCRVLIQAYQRERKTALSRKFEVLLQALDAAAE
ncbi:MAG: hypothetical protein OHK0039_14390 [Bacteroidia bacterium]